MAIVDRYTNLPFPLTRVFTVLFLVLLLTCYQRPYVAGLVTSLTHKSAHFAKASSIKKKKIYLTFDDGPNRGTYNLLDIILDEHVPVSFFVVGKRVFSCLDRQQLWQRMKSVDQIELCNHSFFHAKGHYRKYYQSPDSVVKDFEETNEELKLNNTIGRTPGRNIWRVDSLRVTDVAGSAAAADSLQTAGFTLLGWDLEWRFDRKKLSLVLSAQEMMQQVENAFKRNKTRCANNLVILAHDKAFIDPDDSTELRLFLQMLKQRNEYELSLVSDYPGTERALRPFKLK